jgi:PEGA domain
MRRSDVVLVGITLVSATAWFFLRRTSPPPEPDGRVAPRPAAGLRSAPPGAAVPSRSPRPSSARERGAPGVAGLTVEADVPGADVFVDRVFKGQAPLTLTDVEPGPHRINVSAEGYDGYAETVDVTGQAQTVSVRFKEVRLAAGVGVVHKHTIGSCRGRLSATPAGLRYVPDRGDDAFDVPLASVERLDADYLKKTLTIKLRGGRTYNFTEPSGKADALLAFQQAVAKAQSRLAAAAPK